MSGPRGRIMPPSFTHCRYPRVMSAIPIALAEQYRNLYPFLEKNECPFIKPSFKACLCPFSEENMSLQGG